MISEDKIRAFYRRRREKNRLFFAALILASPIWIIPALIAVWVDERRGEK